MKCLKLFFQIWSVTLFITTPLHAESRDLTLQEVLRAAAETNPAVAAARLRAVAAERGIAVERAGYLPEVNVEAVESTGFPGSVGHLGTEGLIASPYRAGAAAGLVANVPLWDFGRTSSAVNVAQHRAKREEEAANYLRYETYQTALHLYYRCALYRDLSTAWIGLGESATLVRDEVNKFVRTGQRSIVERYLSESQKKEAETQALVATEGLKAQQNEIALLTNLSQNSFSCPALPDENMALRFFHGAEKGNPLVAEAEASLSAAEATVSQRKAGYLPKLVGIAALGAMQDTRLVPNNFYAVGVALIIPVFEGFKTQNEVKEAEALASSTEKELEARKLEIADLNSKYDKSIKTSGIELSRLKDEQTLAEQGFETAKKRYFSLQGSVVDVREALRNLSRTEIDFLNAKANYLEAIGAKSILNGTPF